MSASRGSIVRPVAGLSWIGLRPLQQSRVAPGDPGQPTATRVVVTGTLVVAAVCWVVSVREMAGMDMGVATGLGSLGFFGAVWVAMMAAMMLPGAAPAAVRHARVRARRRGVPLFLVSYLAVWALVGLAVYATYRPHGTSTAAAVLIAAGVYELTPLKRHFRRRCHATIRSGVVFGLDCVGSSIGLMLILLALGVMSVTWMAVIAVVVAAQKLLPAKTEIDRPLGLAIVGLGILIMTVPSSVPGLTAPPM
jgi:predicted metal-binding membrane protein